jgi:transposase
VRSAASQALQPAALPYSTAALLRSVQDLIDATLNQFVQLGQTLRAWSQEIVAMWRFTRNNGITEGFHNKMEMISRRAFGFRNFETTAFV